jgi:hypothetical protein
MLIGLGFSLSGIAFDDEHLCIVTHFPKSFIIYGCGPFAFHHISLSFFLSAYYSAAAVLFQTCLFGLTLVKFIGALRTGWGDVPLLVILVRDGTWAYLLAVGMWTSSE